MKYSVWIQNRAYKVDFVDDGDDLKVLWEGKQVCVDLQSEDPKKSIMIEGQPYEIDVKRNGETIDVNIGNDTFYTRVNRGVVRRDRAGKGAGGMKEEVVSAPMPGMVVTLKVEKDQEVGMGDPLLILEAMKMENELRCPVNGRIKDIYVNTGQKVEKGEKLLVIQM